MVISKMYITLLKLLQLLACSTKIEPGGHCQNSAERWPQILLKPPVVFG